MSIVNLFQSSAKKLKDIRFLAIIALFIALKIVSGRFFHMEVAQNLKIGFTFLIVAVESSIIGPVAGLVSGAITDLVGFFLFPKGPFFPGYVLTAMLGSFFYAIFLYGRKIKLRNIFFAKLCNSVITNMLIGSLWTSMMYTKKTYWGYFTTSAIKNSLLFPIEIILLVLVFNALIPLLNRRHLIDPPSQVPIKF